MKKIIMSFLIPLLLTSCYNKQLPDEEVIKRVDIAKQQLGLFKSSDNSNGKINISLKNDKLETSGLDCNNIIPLLEYKINGYNKEIGYLDLKKGGLKDEIEGGFIKLKYNRETSDNVCLYTASLFDKLGKEIESNNETSLIYKNGISQYNNLFGLDDNKISQKSGSIVISYGKREENDIYIDCLPEKYEGEVYGECYPFEHDGEFNIDEYSIISYLTSLKRVIHFYSDIQNKNSNFNFEYLINENGITYKE